MYFQVIFYCKTFVHMKFISPLFDLFIANTTRQHRRRLLFHVAERQFFNSLKSGTRGVATFHSFFGSHMCALTNK